MPEAQVKMNVRKASDKTRIIDVEGELTAFAENVLMDAYNQASDGHVRAIIPKHATTVCRWWISS